MMKDEVFEEMLDCIFAEIKDHVDDEVKARKLLRESDFLQRLSSRIAQELDKKK
jgi:hypothetical protein